MKKMDFLLIVVILLLAAGLYFSGWLRTGEKGGTAVVFVDGKERERFPLDVDGIYEIEVGNHKNMVEIRDSFADVTEASCPDKLCVKQKKIHLNGETIVCLPNRLVVEVTGGEENKVDGKTG